MVRGILVPVKLSRIVGAMLLAITPLAATERNPEIDLFLGFRSGASFSATSVRGAGAEADPALSWGVSVGWWVRPDGWFEVLFDRQTLEFDAGTSARSLPFDLTVDYLQFGAGYEPPRKGLEPYVTVALGLDRFAADRGSVSRPTGISGSVGGGFKAPIGAKALFRLEARAWASIASGSVEVACGPGCSIDLSGDAWWQIGVRAAFAFCPKGGR